MERSLPTPPNEEHGRSHTSRKGHHHSASAKPTKGGGHRAMKKSTSHSHPSPPHDSHGSVSADGRHKRVWKACERCRMKKTKCDGEFPCKRCKDDGLVCTAGTRKKTEYKQLPKGYAEVLENTQFALIATVHKLYAMVRAGQPWELGDPELNDRRQPVIHDIATKLGCIRPNSDLDLPVHSVFPEDEAGLADLAAQLEAHHRQQQSRQADRADALTDRASSSDLDHSDLETDYRRSAFGRNSTVMALSPQSLAYSDFEVQSDGFAVPSPTMVASYPAASPAAWTAGRTATAGSFLPPPPPPPPTTTTSSTYMDVDMLSQGLLESNFGTIKPHVLSCPNPEVMLGVGDPMIYGGYDAETLRM